MEDDYVLMVVNVGLDDTLFGMVLNVIRVNYVDNVGIITYHIADLVDYKLNPIIFKPVLTLFNGVIIIVSESWREILAAREEIFNHPNYYCCGMCIGRIPSALTEMPNFTIHTPEFTEGLMTDITETLEKKGLM